MKYCPVCETRFDEEVLRFCTKDGTPLIEEVEPKFTELPSENLGDDDASAEEVTQIRRGDSLDEGLPPVTPVSERIVIPTEAPAPRIPVVHARPPATHYVPAAAPPPQNTMKTIVLTVFGTLLVLAAGAGLFRLFQGSEPTARNVNVNTNFNSNVNAAAGIDSNFNFNAITPTNINTNTNYNVDPGFGANPSFGFNSNVRTPTPTQTPRPSPSATPSPSETREPTPTRTPGFNVRPGTPSPTPREGPRPTPDPDSEGN